jgi:murein DD-endopeptidase MepM/ murein hydrolase activator NlpD
MAKTQYPIDGKLGKEYKVTSPFGWRQHPTDPKQRKHHNGVDLVGPAATIYIEAFADGVVVNAGPSSKRLANGKVGGFGYHVIIRHLINGKPYTSVYAHMVEDSLQVKKGQKVTAGTVLGKMGATGDVTGKHLHFEICSGKVYTWTADGKGFVDPLPFIKTVMAAEAVVATAPKATPADAPVAPVAVHVEPAKAPVAPTTPVTAAPAVPAAKPVVAKPVYKEPFAKGTRNDEFGNMASYRKHPHRGQDWSPKDQSPIPAICDGVVTNVFWTDVLGWVVEIKNMTDKVYTQYCHLAPTDPKAPKKGSSATVKKGDKVKLGQIIGKVGGSKATSPSGSASTGAHLHMGMSKQANGHLAPYGKLIDPLKWILAHTAK